ncbi:class I tRNA ligase family protein [Paracerasibacillus soli]
MSIKIYNTLSRKKEVFKPIVENKVKMYVCGPTVYNYIHIGNARPAIAFDTVRRYLEYKGYEVDYVLNFTDVDDKIIQTANESGKEVMEVANKYIEAYKEDVNALYVKQATHHPRVTESMDDIISFIKGLVEKGFAYEVDGDVYFKPRAFDGYGKLSQQSIDELRLVQESKWEKRNKTHWTLPCGSRQNQTKLLGIHLGEKVDQDGILNARLWQKDIWVKRLIFMQGAGFNFPAS